MVELELLKQANTEKNKLVRKGALHEVAINVV
jgi:hypothetical protein